VGKRTRIGVTDGAQTTIAADLVLTEGVAQTPWGQFHRRRVRPQR
jgi:hypothetical protein